MGILEFIGTLVVVGWTIDSTEKAIKKAKRTEAAEKLKIKTNELAKRFRNAKEAWNNTL